jgi:hypothetical protein
MAISFKGAHFLKQVILTGIVKFTAGRYNRICRKFSLGRLWRLIPPCDDSGRGHAGETMIGFKDAHFPLEIMLTWVRWFVVYPLGSVIQVMP